MKPSTRQRSIFFWITLGIPFYMFGQALNPIIRSDGSPKFAMASTLAGTLVNIILDPIFIFLLRWGMMGAAVATVLGQILTTTLAVWYLFHIKAVGLEKNSFHLHSELVKKHLPLGVCSFLSQISLVMAMAAEAVVGGVAVIVYTCRTLNMDVSFCHSGLLPEPERELS